jgi:hypothetical protein
MHVAVSTFDALIGVWPLVAWLAHGRPFTPQSTHQPHVQRHRCGVARCHTSDSSLASLVRISNWIGFHRISSSSYQVVSGRIPSYQVALARNPTRARPSKVRQQLAFFVKGLEPGWLDGEGKPQTGFPVSRYNDVV